MAAAQQLRRAGHTVTLSTSATRPPGGLVRFGVPDFKLEKRVVRPPHRSRWSAEGVELRCGVDVGGDVDRGGAAREVDAVVLATGSRVPRDLRVPGARAATGCTSRWTTSTQRNRWVARERPHTRRRPTARGADQRGGQARGGDRRRRHRRGLHGQRAARGCALDRPAGAPARTPRAPPRRAHPLAGVAAEVPPQLRDGGGAGGGRGRAGLLVTTTRFSGDAEGRVGGAAHRPGRTRPAVRAGRGDRARAPAQLVLLAMGFLHPEPALLDSSAWRRTHAGTSRPSSPTRARSRACSPPATLAAGSH